MLYIFSFHTQSTGGYSKISLFNINSDSKISI